MRCGQYIANVAIENIGNDETANIMTEARFDPIAPLGGEGPDGLWRSVRNASRAAGIARPALFLDRDGVVNVDHGYVHRLDDLEMIDGAAELVAAANRRGIPVIVVTNQSGVGRGYYDWRDFVAFQTAIEDRLAAIGAWIDAVFACPYHATARPPFDVADHPARKPNPGMLLAGAAALNADLATSWIVGDRPGDLQAGSRAGLAGGVLIDAETPEDLRDDFKAIRVAAVADAAQHVDLLHD